MAKVWRRRQVSELARLQRFYADVAAHTLPLATPEIARIRQVGDIAVTFERELPLDFGFLTTAGDPRLDTAITAAVMNMYGPHAHAITRALTQQFAAELGCPTQALPVYQGVYAVATANAFTANGADGHFGWCAAQLSRPDILVALGA